MNYLEKLTELLCTIPEIDKQVKELKFWWILDDKRCRYGFKKIWNTIELHHLMWYCSIKKINFSIENYERFNWEIIDFISFNWTTTISIDNTKPLHQQSEEVLKNIFEALI